MAEVVYKLAGNVTGMISCVCRTLMICISTDSGSSSVDSAPGSCMGGGTADGSASSSLPSQAVVSCLKMKGGMWG